MSEKCCKNCARFICKDGDILFKCSIGIRFKEGRSVSSFYCSDHEFKEEKPKLPLRMSLNNKMDLNFLNIDHQILCERFNELIDYLEAKEQE